MHLIVACGTIKTHKRRKMRLGIQGSTSNLSIIVFYCFIMFSVYFNDLGFKRNTHNIVAQSKIIYHHKEKCSHENI